MYKKESLHKIIHSLEPDELKGILNTLKVGGKKHNNYAILLHILLDMEEYNGLKAETLLRKKTGAKAYKKVKEYLLHFLLDYLNNFSKKQSVSDIVRQHFFLADHFMRKGLFDICEIELNKGETVMMDGEYFGQISLYTQLKLNLAKIGYYSLEQGISDYGTILGIYKKSENLQKYRELEMQASFIRKDQMMGGNNAFEKLLGNPFLEKEHRARLTSSKILFHKIYCLYANYIEDFELLLKHRKQIIVLFEKSQRYLEYQYQEYLFLLIDLANVHVINNEEEEYKELRKKIDNLDLSKSTPDLYVWRLNHYLLHLRKSQKFVEGLELITNDFDFIAPGANLLNPEQKLNLYSNLIVFAFINNDKFLLRHLINEMWESMEGAELFDQAMMLRIIELIRLYDTESFDACESKIRSVTRYFNQEKFKDIHRLIVKAIQKAIKQHYNDEAQSAVAITFEALLNELNSKYSEQNFEEFPYSKWCKAKVKGVTMLELNS